VPTYGTVQAFETRIEGNRGNFGIVRMESHFLWCKFAVTAFLLIAYHLSMCWYLLFKKPVKGEAGIKADK
jgi:hypothetical protein